MKRDSQDSDRPKSKRATACGEAPTELLQLVVQCRDEDDQRDLYEELTTRGYRCRVLSL